MSAIFPSPFGFDPFAFWLHPAPGVKNGHPKSPAARPGPAGHPQHTAPHAKKKKRKAAGKYIFPTRTGDLAVSQGQITFEAEGSEEEKSPYFSRKIIWPGNAESGVTIGRGYDMGGRSAKDITTDLVAAGLDAPSAAVFAQGAGKKGAGPDDKSAQGYVKNHRETTGTISTAVQKKLFENIYPSYITRARASYQFHATSKATPWEQLKPAIRDVIVDLVYQGFGKQQKGYGRPIQAGMANDYQTFIDYIDGNATLRKYEAARHRADYLRAALAQEQIAKPNAPAASAATPAH